jgi:hypothetical protein
VSASPATAPSSNTDPEGRWSSHAPLPVEVIALYGVIIVVLVILGRPTSVSAFPSPILVLDLIVILFFLRYASTTYSMDSERLRARRLFGSRAVLLEDVRRIEYANLRDLSATGFFGGWGWRGRMWSPVVGSFDSIHTRSSGVMVYAGDVPLFVSPRDPPAFALELSRRARSYFPAVELGPGVPGGARSTGDSSGPAQ